MEQSILKSTKKTLGIAEDYDAFDLDVLTWINSAFATLRDLGLGRPGFSVVDDVATWEMFEEDLEAIPLIRTYVHLKTRIMFDPPSTSYVLESQKQLILEQEFRLGTIREGRDWVRVPPTKEETDP